ncbi:MAG: ATP-binding cassette domain-containing protein [Cyclobacteriaceae bacterium]
MIRVENLMHAFGSREISYPDFEVSASQHFWIIGNSGCGKTTLLHLLAGLRKIQQGSVTVGDQRIQNMKGVDLDKFRGQNIGLIFQKPHLLTSLSVRDNLSTAQFLASKKRDVGRVNSVLHELNLSALISSKPNQLSQGEAQRVAIARAVINKPKVILADEPTSSLDDENCSKVLDLMIKEANIYGATLIVVTHDQRVKDQIANGIKLEAL